MKKISNIIFVLSVPFLTALLSGSSYYTVKDIKIFVLVLITSFLTGIFLKKYVLKDSIENTIKQNKKYKIPILLITLYTIGILIEFTNNGSVVLRDFINNKFNIYIAHPKIFSMIFAIFSIPSIYSLLYLLFVKSKKFLLQEKKKITKCEKKFLIYTLIVGTILTTFIFFKTNAFYEPKVNDEVIIYDVIYTTDSGSLTKDDAYTNVSMAENDLRQPFFGLMSLPFSISARFISEFFKFIPKNYEIIFTVIQILLLAISLIWISRMLKIKDKNKKYFYLLTFSTFPFILFSFVREQYIMALFYLILTIYLWYIKYSEINYSYIASTGSLLTSGVLLPTISKYKNFKYWFKNVFKCFIAFMIILVISGRLKILYNLKNTIDLYLSFSGKEISFIDKILQYLNFCASIFIAPKGEIVYIDEAYSYFLSPVNKINILGIIFLIICIISFILNRKEKLAQVSILWVLFSFILLGLIGWGTAENGLILYSLYFSWAFIVLIYLFIKKIIKDEKIRKIVIISLVIILLIFNIPEFINIIKFGIKYYPN